MRSRDPWLESALTVVRAASGLVPADRRREWQAGWHGDLLALRAEHVRGRRSDGAGSGLDLVWRALGAWRDAWYVRTEGVTVDAMIQSVRGAWRGVWRAPAFAVTTIGILGLGIGLTTVMFSVVNGVLMRPLDYADADRIVRVLGFSESRESARLTGNVSYPNAVDFNLAATASFDGIAAAHGWNPALVTGDAAEVLVGATVTSNYFDVMGAQPALGRFFRPEAQGEGRPDEVVITHSLWTRHFGRLPAAVGQTAEFNGTSYTVIGVAPPGFEDPGLVGGPGQNPEVFRTSSTNPVEGFRSGRSWFAVGRLAPGATVEEARAELAVVMSRLAELYPDENSERGLTAEPLHEHLTAATRPMLWTLVGIVGLVLLVTCANVAGLFLGRALDREREFAVRAAIGASRGRLFAQLLSESTLLALAGGAFGLLLVPVGIRAVRVLAGSSLPLAPNIAVDGRVLLFALGASVLTGLVFGMAPALRASGTSSETALRASRGATAGRRSQRLRRVLVAAEVTLSVFILVGTGLLLRTLWNLQATDLGVDTESVVAADLHGVRFWELEPEAAVARWADILEHVEAVPGVEAAGASDYLPLDGHYSCDGFWRGDRPPPEPGQGRCAEVRTALPGLFEALGVPLRRGRGLAWRDGTEDARVAVVSQDFAASVFPDEEAVGMPLHVHGEDWTIVGVVGEVLHFGAAGLRRPHIYLPAAQEPWNGAARGLTLIVRGRDGAPPSEATLRAAVAAVDPLIPVTDIRAMDDVLAQNLASPRFRAILFASFGGLATFLAVLGLAAIMAYSVRQRRREIGVRMACGAAATRVVREVMADGVRLTLAGIIAGLAGAALAGRLLQEFLYEVRPVDPWVFGVVPILFAGVSLLALGWPARSAASVDPATVLREE